MGFVPVDLRLRSWISDDELAAKVGKIVTHRDYNALFTGPARLYRPDGTLLAVYMPGVLSGELQAAWAVLSSIRLISDNRGLASGTPRVQRGDQKRTRTAGRLPVCRLTAWTGRHLPEWMTLTPLFQAIDRHYREQVPDRYHGQQLAASVTHSDWLIPETVFTTVTVNNSYSTGVHQDAGDLPEGFSTLAVARRGDYTGGQLVLPRYRVAFAMGDGDLLLFDAHEWHGNTAMWCPHQDVPLYKPCPAGCERVSLVTYFRTKMRDCGTHAEETAKALAAAEATT